MIDEQKNCLKMLEKDFLASKGLIRQPRYVQLPQSRSAQPWMAGRALIFFNLKIFM
jgi:hypothetical protein